MSLKKQAISGVYWAFLQQFSNQIINFIVSIILARVLFPADFGIISIIGLFIGVGTVLMDGGLTQSLIRTTNVTDEDFSIVFLFNLIASVFIYILIFFLAPQIAFFYNQDTLTKLIRCYCVVFVINAFSNIQHTRLMMNMDFKTELKVTLPSMIIANLVGITMAFSGFGVWSLVISSIFSSLLNTIQLWYWSSWKPTLNFSKEKVKQHFGYGYKLTLSGLLDTIFSNTYAIVIGKFFSIQELGYFNRADSLKQFPVNNVSSVLNKITFPLFSKIQNDDIKLKEVYKKIMQMVIFLIAPLLIFLAVLGEPLFRFLFTEKWLPAVPYFQILCFSGLLYPIHAYNLNILKVKGRSDLFLKLEVIKKIVIVLITLIAYQFGIYGLLYSTVFLNIIGFFINTHYTGRFLNYTTWEQTKDITPTIFLASCCGFIVCTLNNFTIEKFNNDFISIVFCSGIGFFLYLCTSFLFKINSLKEIISIIKNQ